jgi:hypothetical protein
MTTFLEAFAGNGLALTIASILVFFLRSHLGSYLAQKGKNLATFEDIQKLVAQVQATEQTKADIAAGMWDRQTRWTAKRERYEALIDNLTSLMTSAQDYSDVSSPDEHKAHLNKLMALADTKANTHRVSRLFIPNDVNDAYTAAWDAFTTVAVTIRERETEAIVDDLTNVYSQRLDEFIAAARKDLGYEG